MSLEALNAFSKIIWMMITIIDIPNALKSNSMKSLLIAELCSVKSSAHMPLSLVILITGQMDSTPILLVFGQPSFVFYM